MIPGEKVVAYADLIGFGDLVVKDIGQARELLSCFYDLAQQRKLDGNFNQLELFLFSDFMLVQGEDVSEVVNYSCDLYRHCLRANTEELPAALLARGGVAAGSVVTQKRREAARVTKNFIISPALVHAVRMEKLTKGQRLLISASDREEMSHFWNSRFSAITYDQPLIESPREFMNYRYHDLLWARDLKKAVDEARKETSDLIKVAARLHRTNHGNASVSVHYAETLRLCFLSYSSLLQPTEADHQLLSELVGQTLIPYPADTVWLGFLEMVFLSPDAFAFERNIAMQSFLRAAVLSTTWGKVCKLLDTPEHRQLRDRLQAVVDSIVT